MNEITIFDNSIKRMTSLEISDLVESRHDKVKQSIERLASRGVIELPPTGEVRNHLGQTISVDRIASADGLMNITGTAKALDLPRVQDLTRYLLESHWIYRRVGGKNYVAYQHRLQQGLLAHKVTTVQTTGGRGKIVEQVLVTTKGLARLSAVFCQKSAN